MCMGGAMRGWCCLMFSLCISMHLVVGWASSVLVGACIALLCFVCGDYLCVYLCNMIVGVSNYQFVLMCIFVNW